MKAELDNLPNHATGDDVVHLLEPFYAAEGGHVTLKAGADGGGNFNVTDAKVQGGSGPGGGGKVTAIAGDGCLHGKGGDVNITRSVITGGDAK